MIDWVAGAFELIGSWCVGNKWKIGFISNLIGNVAWIYVALTTQIYGLLLVVVPSIVINTMNFFKWRKYDNGEGICTCPCKQCIENRKGG